MAAERHSETVIVDTLPGSYVPRRASWAAIFAGLFVGLATLILLGLFGAAVGLSMTDADYGRGATWQSWLTSAGVWTFISVIAAMFLGGYVAGRLSGLATSADGAWQGLAHWGAGVVLAALLFGWGLQTTLGSLMWAAGQGINMAGTAVTRTAGAVGAGTDWVAGQADRLLGDIGIADLPADARRDLLARLTARDYEGAAALLAERGGTDLDRAEIRRRIDRFYVETRETVRDVGERALDYSTTAAWVTFFALLLGLGASVAGGALGTPGNLLVARGTDTTTPTPTATTRETVTTPPTPVGA